MWAARHLTERQQRKFVGAGGSSRGRLPKEEALSRRAAQREKELRRAREDYANKVPVIPVPASDGPSELSASMAKRIVGDAKKADSMAWPAEMKTKD